ANMTITGMGDYPGSISKTFEILKADPTMVKAPVAVENLVYNGKAQTLVVAGKVENGVMVYKLKGADKYSKTLPTATKAGDYTVYFMVRGNDNYNYLKAQTLTVSIEASSSSSVEIASSSSKEQGDGFAFVAASGLKVQFVRNELTVTATTASEVKVYVFDLQGNLKKRYHGQSAGTHSVSLGQLNQGLYLVRVVSSGNVQTLRAQVK
ncbi:MAG: T9SS type A sorting domain-containing protein, partial [Fibrobacter sp.]|nr:T9SS type A sorting domain-containing protein [Fibrobacter sp.]